MGWRFNNSGDKDKIIDISQWGVLHLGNNGAYFYGANNLDISAIDDLDLTETTNLSRMFMFILTGFPKSNLNILWDTSNVTDMSGMFTYSRYSGDVSNWNTSSVINMRLMFSEAAVFNQDISGWTVGQVTTCTDFSAVTSSSWTSGEKPNFTSCVP